MRLDQLLFQKGYFESRQKARYAIQNGLVKVNGKTITKVSLDCSPDNLIEVIKGENEYVSRGGQKLLKAIETFEIALTEKVILDVGASTGGFTDCALQHGAKLVYAIDVGSNQLVSKLLQDSRVISKENMNFRYAKSSDLDNMVFDYILIDVSFISLKFIFANLESFCKENTQIVALIKPQFELYEESVEHKGIISKPSDHCKAIEKVIEYANDNGYVMNKLTYSPIVGEKKENIEFLGLFSKRKTESINLEEIVKQAHDHLKG